MQSKTGYMEQGQPLQPRKNNGVQMILIQTGKALQALYVGSILNEMAAGIMDAEEGAEEVERMFFHATAE